MNKVFSFFFIIGIIGVGLYILVLSKNSPSQPRLESSPNENIVYSSGDTDTSIKIHKNIQSIGSLGNSTSAVANAYYSPENKDIIDNWLNDKSNRAQSSRGDIIEFLSYCEQLNVAARDKKANLIIFGEYDLGNLEAFMTSDSAIQDFALKNPSLTKTGSAYSNLQFSTETIRQYYIQNKKELSQDSAPYVLTYNEIYAFLQGETSLTDFDRAMTDIIKLNHNSSKLYSGLYRQYYLSSSPLECREILREYGNGEESFQEYE